MDFNEPTTLQYMQGQLLTLQQAVQGLIHAAPHPHATWLAVADFLDGWADIAANEPGATDPVVAGMRDAMAQLSIGAPRPSPG